MQQDGAGGEGNNIHLLLSILADGEQQARQLAETMVPDDPRLGGAVEHYRGAARRLQRTLGKAVSVARVIEAAAASRGTDSPRSADESSGGTAAVEPLERPGMCKRRKGLPRWTAKFRMPDASSEATPDDGFSWRKYGQKDILGAKFPRGYYRCTYRAAQGCLATKQVQRSDSDLCVFDVTYHGEHTCHQRPQHQQQRHAYASTVSPRGATGIVGHPPLQDPSTELLTGFQDCLKVETADASPLHDHDRDYHNSSAAAPFSFPSAVPPHAAGPSFSPSPAAAGSSYYAVPHCLVSPGSGNSYDDYSSCYSYGRARGAESELAEVVSRATSAPAATVGTAAAADLSAAAAGFDYSLYHHDEFDPHLPFAPSGAGSGPPRH